MLAIEEWNPSKKEQKNYLPYKDCLNTISLQLVLVRNLNSEFAVVSSLYLQVQTWNLFLFSVVRITLYWPLLRKAPDLSPWINLVKPKYVRYRVMVHFWVKEKFAMFAIFTPSICWINYCQVLQVRLCCWNNANILHGLGRRAKSVILWFLCEEN
jgi:hypothetical protein